MAYHGFRHHGKSRVSSPAAPAASAGRSRSGCAQAGAKVVAGSTNPDKVAAMKKELGDGPITTPSP